MEISQRIISTVRSVVPLPAHTINVQEYPAFNGGLIWYDVAIVLLQPGLFNFAETDKYTLNVMRALTPYSIQIHKILFMYH